MSTPRQHSKRTGSIQWNTVAIFCLFILVGTSVGDTAEPKPGISNWETLNDEAELRKIFVEKSRLKDPFSIQFRKVQVGDITDLTATEETRGLRRIWCGEVNAKNLYGAYAGWNFFFASDFEGKTSVTIDDSNSVHEAFFLVMRLYCKGSSLNP